MTEVKCTKKWYVIRSVSGKENKIKEYIESEIKSDKKHYDKSIIEDHIKKLTS